MTNWKRLADMTPEPSLLEAIAFAEGSLHNFIVLFRDVGDGPVSTPLVFHCQADDGDHAEEQCVDAYPDCNVVWVYRGDDWQAAFDEWLGEDK